MTTFYLVRHAMHDWVGRGLAGRTDVPLSGAGFRQAERLAERLAREAVEVIQSSPLKRTRQTADAVASRLGLPVETADALTEIDFGSWAGRDFDALDQDPDWCRWNRFRSAARTPAGDTMAAVQARFVGHMLALHARHPGKRVLLVSHADPIRAALAYWVGVPLDAFLRLDVSPAGISIVDIGDWAPRIITLNEMVPE